MQKTFTIYPRNVNTARSEKLTNSGYCDQFNVPFTNECVDFIDAKLNNGDHLAIDIVIKNDKGIGVGSATVTPTQCIYLGELDDEFDNLLLKLRRLGTLTISVHIRVIGPSPLLLADLVRILSQIEEQNRNDDKREGLVYHALGLAKQLGYPAGIRIDPRDINWPVVIIVLPEVGEVFWHCSAYKLPIANFDDAEQHNRIRLFIEKHI
jgi:hypothetical protein